MRLKLKFNIEDWNVLDKYLREWDEWRKGKRGRPDYTSDAIFSIPLIISLLKSSEKLKWITWILIVLTLILAIETTLLIFS